MNDSPSDGSENITDIFVLCKSEADVPVQPELLEQKGYRVTLFSDSTQLFETLRYGKPNLLVCDSLSLGAEAYTFSRQIKADADLWMIPVLIVTSSSSLSDLLSVLDCNADNFIASPFEPAYLLSLIEMMLITPVEQPTTEQITTQFKIRHDDQEFVVMADRRKLLEFLLSSFEIMVARTGEINRAGSEIRSLSTSLKRSEDAGTEQARIIGIMNENLQQREESIGSLNGEIRKRDGQIAELTREKEFLIEERDENKSRIAALEEEGKKSHAANEDLARTSGLEIAGLKNRVTELDAGLSATRSELATTQSALEAETRRREDAEGMLAELEPQKEQAEKSVRALTLECEQLKNSCITERNRAVAASQETKSVLQAKADSEQDLTRIIDELKEKAKQHAEEIGQLKENLEQSRDQITVLGSQLRTITDEKSNLEDEARTTAADLSGRLKTASDEGAALRSALDERNRQAAALEDSLKNERAERERAQTEIQELGRVIAAAKTALEQERQKNTATIASLEAALHEREANLAAITGAHAEARTNLDVHRDDLAQVRQELAAAIEDRTTLKARLEEAGARIRSLEERLKAEAGEKTDSEKLVGEYSGEIARLKAALDEERRQRVATEEQLRTAAAATERTGKSAEQAQGEISRLKTALDEEHRQRVATEEQLRTAAAVTERTEKLAQQAQSEMEKAREQLAMERERSAGERERLAALLEAEKNKSDGTGERSRAEAETLNRRIGELSAELARSARKVEDLEEQVRSLGSAKQKAEETAAALEAELDQARVALADEWEEHVTADERLAAVVGNSSRGETARPALEPAHATDPGAIAQTTIPAGVQEISGEDIAKGEVSSENTRETPSGVDDLFEEERPDPAMEDDTPQVSIVREDEPDITAMPVIDTEDPVPAAPGDGDDEAGDISQDILPKAPFAPVTYGFDRTQWFDLLKWAHHSGALSQEQRLQIVRMGRLVQKGRRLTRRQDEQVRDILSLVQSLGYRFA